jgi:hypothetical protein
MTSRASTRPAAVCTAVTRSPETSVALQLGLVRHHEEIALLVKIARDAHLVLEALEEGHPAEGELDLHARRKLHANAARRLARGAGADGLALEHDHVARAAPREVIRDARADGAGTNDDDVCALRKHSGRQYTTGPSHRRVLISGSLALS